MTLPAESAFVVLLLTGVLCFLVIRRARGRNMGSIALHGLASWLLAYGGVLLSIEVLDRGVTSM
ncbi:hypothetical protein [Sphingomonas sp. 3-13AW]|uniref:hypothetical protein n=1 Tax=Sphingomonas sp. 3-13AW TaxID=3050450 RepID=UPI003BB4AD3E